MNCSILSNGEISIGSYPAGFVKGSLITSESSNKSFSLTITTDHLGGKSNGKLLLATFGLCGINGRYIHSAPSVSNGSVSLYLNSNSESTKNNQTITIFDAVPGTIITENAVFNVSTYSYSHTIQLWLLQ